MKKNTPKVEYPYLAFSELGGRVYIVTGKYSKIPIHHEFFKEITDLFLKYHTPKEEDAKLKTLLSFIPFDEMGYQKFFQLAKEYLNELDERDHPQDVKDMIIQGMEEGAAEWQREAEDIALALTGLVILKDIKDKPNKSAAEIKQYEMSKPEAWEEARKVLQRTQAGQRIKNKMQPYLDFLQSRPQTELEILNTRCGPPPDNNEGDEEELIRQLKKQKSTPKEEKEEWISVREKWFTELADFIREFSKELEYNVEFGGKASHLNYLLRKVEP